MNYSCLNSPMEFRRIFCLFVCFALPPWPLSIMRVGSRYSANIRQSPEFQEAKHLGKCFKIPRTVPSDLHQNPQSPEFYNTGNID